MSRALLVIANETVRQRATNWIARAPIGTRVEFKAPKRTLDQNARFWAMLSDIASQKEHMGRRYTTEQWKCIFMSACGHEMQFLPSLDGATFIPYGNRSSDLSKEDMSNLMAFMEGWAAESGVVFHDQAEQAA